MKKVDTADIVDMIEHAMAHGFSSVEHIWEVEELEYLAALSRIADAAREVSKCQRALRDAVKSGNISAMFNFSLRDRLDELESAVDALDGGGGK